MTEEFMNIFAKIGKTPFEEQMKQTIKSFENMVHIFMEMPEKIDNRLDSIQAQINSLEAQINMLIKKVAELQRSPNPSQLGPDPAPSPTPTANKINPAVAKKEVMNELRDLLEKRKRQLDDE